MNEMCEALLREMSVAPLDEAGRRMMNPLGLAYIGDAVHEMFVRTYVVSHYTGSVNKLNQKVVAIIKATAQAKALCAIMDHLTEEEMTVVKRGRNAKSLTVPKNTSVSEYRQATGFEALLGHLFLSGNKERLIELVARSIQLIEEEDK